MIVSGDNDSPASARRRSAAAFRRARRLGALLAALGLVWPLAAHLEPDNAIYVDGGAVAIEDDSSCSLGEAIQNADDTTNGVAHADCAPGDPGGPDTIVLPANSYFALTEVYRTGEYGPYGLPWVSSAVTIIGNGATIWRNDSFSEFRIFSVGPLGNLTLNGVKITGARSSSYEGDAIFNQGILTLQNSHLYNNFGEAILSSGELGRDATLTIIGSTVDGSEQVGVWNRFGVAQIVNSTLSNNRGGGLLNGRDGRTTVISSTITKNTATNGGGLNNFQGTTTLRQTLVSGNQANSGAGMEVFNNGGVVNSGDTNLFGHSGLFSSEAFSGFTPGGSDIVASADAGNVALDAILAPPLMDFGGPTPTHALPAGSPAIDRVPSSACVVAPVNNVDQRGRGRNANGDGVSTANECDVGAFERAGGAPPTPAPLFLPVAVHAPETFFEGPWEDEPNNLWQTEADGPLRLGRAYQGRPNDLTDIYYARVNRPGRLVADVTGHQGAGPRLGFYTVRSDGVYFRLAQVDTAPLHLELEVGEPGLVYIEISTAQGFTVQPYTLVVRLE